MDEVNSIHIAWTASIIDLGGPGVYEHSILNMQGPTYQFIDGKIVEMPGFSGREVIEFLPPVGKVEAFYFDHPEPFTLPKNIPGVKNVTVKGMHTPAAYMTNLIEMAVRYGLTSREAFMVEGRPIAPLTFLTYYISHVLAPHARSEKIESVEGGLRVDVIGNKGGEEVKYTLNSSIERSA